MQRHVWGPTRLVARRRIRHQGILCRVADCRAEAVKDEQRLAHMGAFPESGPRVRWDEARPAERRTSPKRFA